jgi:hypothetical protein
MAESSNKKYSKISSALKYYFLSNLYYQCLDIKEVTLYSCRRPINARSTIPRPRSSYAISTRRRSVSSSAWCGRKNETRRRV